VATLETGLRRARLKSGLKQSELAERAGISRQTLSVLESGRGQPSTSVALHLARVLGCRVEELFWLRDEAGELTAELAQGADLRGAKAERAVVGSVAGRWVAHPLSREDPLALTTSADALLLRARRPDRTVRLRALRPSEALQANVLVAGCDPGLSVLSGHVEDRGPGSACAGFRWEATPPSRCWGWGTRTSPALTSSTKRRASTTFLSFGARSVAARWWW